MPVSDETFEMPMGFAMSMAQNPDAMNAFGVLSQEEKAAVIAKAKAVRSREEMTGLVTELAKKSDNN